MITGLQHAIPTVATLGENTDAILKQQDGTGILLARNNSEAFSDKVLMLVRDRALRERIGAGGKALFDSFFSWPVIASKMLGYLAEGGTA
jgi:glycosyltransferase involved in cell wall biosynthesis